MRRARVLQRALGAGVAAVAGAALLVGAAAPAQADVPEGTVVAVTGTNGAVYSRVAGQASWTNLGGVLVAPPAVANLGPITHYLGTGSNRVLYHRTNTSGWAKLSDGYCTDVSATVAGDQVVVSCRGGNGALYAGAFTGTAQRPVGFTLTKLGGQVLGAVPVVVGPDGPVFFARGPEYVDEEGFTGNTYVRDSVGWSQYGAFCDGTPAAAGSSDEFFFACQSGASVIAGEVFYLDDADQPQDLFYEVPGQAIGTPALSLLGGRQAELFVQGADRVLYHRTIGPEGPSTARWSKVSSLVLGGVAAAPVYAL